MQNNIGCCSVKSLTFNFCFPPPPDNQKNPGYALTVVNNKILAWHPITLWIEGFRVNIMHHAAVCVVSLVKSQKKKKKTCQSTSPVHQSSPPVQSSDCRWLTELACKVEQRCSLCSIARLTSNPTFPF